MWRKVWIGAVLAGLALAAVCCALPLKPIRGTLLVDRGHRLSRGLVGCWLLNEGGGTRFNDLSGNGSTGTITGATWAAGRFGPCVSFGGAGYLDVGNVARIVSVPAFSVACWVQPASLRADDTIVSRTVSVKNRWQLAMGGTNYGGTTNLTLSVCDGENSYGWTTSNPLVVGKLIHVAMVFDGSQSGNDARLKLYVNGIQQTITWGVGVTIPASTSTNTVNVLFGVEMPGTWNRYYSGTIDLPTIYSRALTAAEIAELYHDPFAMFRRVPVEYYVSAPAAPPAGGGRHQVIIIAKAALPACIPLGIVASMTFMMWCERRRAT